MSTEHKFLKRKNVVDIICYARGMCFEDKLWDYVMENYFEFYGLLSILTFFFNFCFLSFFFLLNLVLIMLYFLGLLRSSFSISMTSLLNAVLMRLLSITPPAASSFFFLFYLLCCFSSSAASTSCF